MSDKIIHKPLVDSADHTPSTGHGPENSNAHHPEQTEKPSIHPHEGHREQGQIIGNQNTVRRDEQRSTFGSGNRGPRNNSHHKPGK